MDRRWIPGNQFTLLENGEEFFPRVFACIANARREVIVETFILFEDKVGLQLHEALLAAARRGAQVDITVDDWGSPDFSERYLRDLREAGVRVHTFNPGIRPFGWRPHLLRRMHRKIAVVDGEVAFVGGINYSADHLSDFGPEGKQEEIIPNRSPHRVATDLCRRLARPLDPAQKPGVMQPPPRQGVDEGGFRAGVGDQVEPVARMFAHDSLGATAAQTRSATSSGPPVASISTHRSGCRSAMARKPSRSRWWKASPLLSNRVSNRPRPNARSSPTSTGRSKISVRSGWVSPTIADRRASMKVSGARPPAP